MKISYKKLWVMLAEKEISQVKFRKDLTISTGTMTKLRKNEEVALSVILRICEYLDCFKFVSIISLAFLVAHMVKHLSTMQKTQV